MAEPHGSPGYDMLLDLAVQICLSGRKARHSTLDARTRSMRSRSGYLNGDRAIMCKNNVLQAAANKAKLEKRLELTAYPLDFSTALRVVRDSLAAVSPAPMSCPRAPTPWTTPGKIHTWIFHWVWFILGCMFG